MERQDQLFLDEEGTPWVRTDPAPDVEDDDIRRHRASRAEYERFERAGAVAGTVAGAAVEARGGPVEGVSVPRSGRWQGWPWESGSGPGAYC